MFCRNCGTPLTATYRVHKAYEQYKMTGAFPTAPVGGNR